MYSRVRTWRGERAREREREVRALYLPPSANAIVCTTNRCACVTKAVFVTQVPQVDSQLIEFVVA